MTAQPSATPTTGQTTGRRAPAANTAAGDSGAPADNAFLVGSTLTLAGIGALQAAGALPWLVPGDESILVEFYDSLPPWAQLAFGAWQASATLLGLVLPTAAIAWWGRRDSAGRAVRAALAPYTLVLLWQVLLEAALARVFFPNIVVLAGMIYTAYRIRQLLHARRVFTAAPSAQTLPAPARRAVTALLTAGIVFWPLNLAFLLTTQLPRILNG